MTIFKVKQLSVAFVGILFVVGVFWYVSQDNSVESQQMEEITKNQIFLSDGLKTDTSVKSIDLSQVLDGGPGKDGIPALTNPKFVHKEVAREFLDDDSRGILVEVGGEAKFYPYTVIVWHEVVNDVVGGKSLVITFCPLCGTAIVFDARLGDKIFKFGVSGKLYESNLLMYDKETESLWSQALGEAVVGFETGKKLNHYPSQLLTFREVVEKYSEVRVLSEDTGHRRDYGQSPYGNYEENEQLYFPVTIQDNRLPAKELMYIVNVDAFSVALQVSELPQGRTILDVGEGVIEIIREGSEITVRDSQSKEIIPGYHSMWFSWATFYQEDQENSIVWLGQNDSEE